MAGVSALGEPVGGGQETLSAKGGNYMGSQAGYLVVGTVGV